MDIKTIQDRIREGNYLAKPHAVQHALKEGFARKHIVEAILNGEIIEEYPEVDRVLICGHSTFGENGENTSFYLHIVCEYTHPVFVEFVTAYIPDETQWERPTFKHRVRKKR